MVEREECQKVHCLLVHALEATPILRIWSHSKVTARRRVTAKLSSFLAKNIQLSYAFMPYEAYSEIKINKHVIHQPNRMASQEGAHRAYSKPAMEGSSHQDS